MQTVKATSEVLTPAIFALFRAFINQRSGLDRNNYFNPADKRPGVWRDGWRAYQQELKAISKQGVRARLLLAQAEEYPFDAAAMMEATRAFSGRLEFLLRGSKLSIDYCAGQYYATEYRAAAAAVLENYIHAVKPRQLPQPSDHFDTISDLAAASERAGLHWFSPGTKKFFSSRIFPTLYKGNRLIWFVSSERTGFDIESPRAFSVRVFDTLDASVNTVGEFNSYSSLGDARLVARELRAADKDGKHVKPSQESERCAFCGSYDSYCSGKAAV
jgi:hypothetical protein